MKLPRHLVLRILGCALAAAVPASGQAFTFSLTSGGLGVSGNVGPLLDVDPLLQIAARTKIGHPGFPNGKAGTVYVGSYGLGVQGDPWCFDPKPINGSGYWSDEALRFDFSSWLVPGSVKVGLKKFNWCDDNMILMARSQDGDEHYVTDQSVLKSAFTYAGYNYGYLSFGKIDEIAELDCIDYFEVRATCGDFYVKNVCGDPSQGGTPPVPEPASVLLVGTGLAGWGLRRIRKRRRA
jgi:hypothetical protein